MCRGVNIVSKPRIWSRGASAISLEMSRFFLFFPVRAFYRIRPANTGDKGICLETADSGRCHTPLLLLTDQVKTVLVENPAISTYLEGSKWQVRELLHSDAVGTERQWAIATTTGYSEFK